MPVTDQWGLFAGGQCCLGIFVCFVFVGFLVGCLVRVLFGFNTLFF